MTTQPKKILFLGDSFFSSSFIRMCEVKDIDASLKFVSGFMALDMHIANQEHFDLAIVNWSGVETRFSTSGYDEIFSKLKPMMDNGMQIIILGGTGRDRHLFNYPKFDSPVITKSEYDRFYDAVDRFVSTPRDVKKILYVGEAVDHYKLMNMLELKNGHFVQQIDSLENTDIDNLNNYDAIVVSSLYHKDSFDREIVPALEDTVTPVILFSNWNDHKTKADAYGFTCIRRADDGDSQLLNELNRILSQSDHQTPSLDTNHLPSPEFS
jgi:hypothetical protein